ncbi:MAG: hypothetical protein LUJ09_00070 [Firmicutes bacterium]|nr:hypothetical protein [Bacillota bacterium]
MGETSIGGALRKMKAEFRDMTFRQRVSYFFYYYKGAVLAVIVAGILLGSLIYDMSRPTTQTLVNGMAVNVAQTQALQECLTDGMLDALGGTDPETQAANLSHATITDARGDADAVINNNYSELLTITAQVSTGNLDYLLTDGAARDFLLTQGLFGDLSAQLSPALLTQLADVLVYQTSEDGEDVPVAIDLTGTAFGQTFAGEDGTLYLGFPGNSTHSDRAEDVIGYLLAWEPGNFAEND